MEDRNRNYASIMRNLNFSSRGWYDVQSQVDEVDDHVKRKVRLSPGCNNMHLLPAGVTGQGRSLSEHGCSNDSAGVRDTRLPCVSRWLLSSH